MEGAEDPATVTDPLQCQASGDGLHTATVRQPAHFNIVAYDREGRRRQKGGDSFFVAVRGGSKIHARMHDHGDGTYKVEYRPSVSGKYTIAISLLGQSLVGSPFALSVITPQPDPTRCELRGEALTSVIARNPHSFEVRFRDALGLTSTAEELDVFVEAVTSPSNSSSFNSHDHVVNNAEVMSESEVRAMEEEIDAPETAEVDQTECIGLECDSVVSPTSNATATATSLPTFKRARVEVRDKPLILRKGFDTASSLIGKLRIGQLFNVVEERWTKSGDLRAKIALIFDDESVDFVTDTWESVHPALRVFDPTAMHPTTDATSVSALLSSTSATSRLFGATTRLPTAYEGTTTREPNALSSTVAVSGAFCNTSCGSLVVGSADHTPTKDASSPTSKKPKLTKTSRHNAGHLSTSTTTKKTAATEMSATTRGTSRDEAGSIVIQDTKGNAKTCRYVPSKKTSRSALAHPPSDRKKMKSKVRTTGWVTIVKDGVELVRRRERLDAGQRQLHIQQWARRQAADKTFAASQGMKVPAVAGKKQGSKSTTTSGSGTAYSKGKSVFAQELESDPSEIGFAFGGIDPGILHAKGMLHEVHKVTYSVGRAGRYLLHVRLRNQALPLPGSPFNLTVRPAGAHAQSTTLPPSILPLRGMVGTGGDAGCHVVLPTADKMGNVCDRGGASVQASCSSTKVESEVIDNQDGTYSIAWRSKFSGTSQVYVTIDGTHVVGSPASMRLTSTQPDLSRTEIMGDGLVAADAGKPAVFKIKFVDEYANIATPGAELMVGLGFVPEAVPPTDKAGVRAVAPSSSKISIQDLDAHDHKSEWVAEGELEVTYVATTAGFNDLFVWCERSKGERARVPLPGSPWRIEISSGKGNVANSEVNGYIRESESQDKPGGKASFRQLPEYQSDNQLVVAGDVVLMRPKILDEFGNPALLPDGALSVLHELPDGEQDPEPMVVQPQTRGGLTTYDIRDTPTISGTHKAHILLFGKPIKGSPVAYCVKPDYHDPSECTLNAPANPPVPPHFYTEDTYIVDLTMRDRFGNQCDRGGAVVGARLIYLKQGVHDSTSLTSGNHSVSVEDRQDGTYGIAVSLSLGSSERALFPAGVNVEVNLDRDPKERPTGINLPPVTMLFLRNPATETALGMLHRGGKLVQAANAAIKGMKEGVKNGGGAPAAAPANAPVAPR